MNDEFSPWLFSEHDLSRMERMRQDRGHYTKCRHYVKTGERTLNCRRHGQRRTCEGCLVCPNCGGMMATYRMTKDYHRTQIFITHAKSCVICGAYIEENYVVAIPKQQSTKAAEACQVHGCRHTAYEGYTHTEESAGRSLVFRICVTHVRRMKTWRLHPGKGEEHKPLLLEAGKLIDNPRYAVKQRKK